MKPYYTIIKVLWPLYLVQVRPVFWIGLVSLVNWGTANLYLSNAAFSSSCWYGVSYNPWKQTVLSLRVWIIPMSCWYFPVNTFEIKHCCLNHKKQWSFATVLRWNIPPHTYTSFLHHTIRLVRVLMKFSVLVCRAVRLCDYILQHNAINYLLSRHWIN